MYCCVETSGGVVHRLCQKPLHYLATKGCFLRVLHNSDRRPVMIRNFDNTEAGHQVTQVASWGRIGKVLTSPKIKNVFQLSHSPKAVLTSKRPIVPKD